MKRIGITQEGLAQVLGCRPETVTRWMRGKTNPTIEQAFMVKELCFPALSVDYLFSTTPIAYASEVQ